MIIIGDSWGCGEWNVDDYSRVAHKGIEQFCINENIPVTNLSRPGADNFGHLGLFGNNTFLDEKIFWFITCPLRDFRAPFSEDPFVAGKRKLNELFSKMSLAAQKNNLKIYLLGGLCDLDQIDVDYPNLELAIPSITKFLFDDYCVSSMFGDITAAARVIDNKTFALDVFSQIEKKYNFFRTSTYFPDNGHPDRHAHQRIFQHIKQYL